MNINFDKLKSFKNEQEARNARTNRGPRVNFWRPKSGKNTIRILPAWASEGEFEGQFWFEVFQHWNISTDSKAPVLCTEKTSGHNTPCPVCAAIKDLWNQADTTTDPVRKLELTELAKSFKAKSATLLSIVDLNDATYTAEDLAKEQEHRPGEDAPFEVGELKIQLYAAGPSVFNLVRDTIIENELDVTDPKKGNDFSIEKKGSGFDTTYNVVPKMKASALKGYSPDMVLPALNNFIRVLEVEKIEAYLAASIPTQLSGSSKAAVASLPEDALPESFGGAGDADDGEDLAAKLKGALGGS